MTTEDKSPLFSAVAFASNSSFLGSPKTSPIAGMIRRDLAMRLAMMIVESGKLSVTEGEFETTFRLEVMVMSPDDLFREAAKIAKAAAGRGSPFFVLEAKP